MSPSKIKICGLFRPCDAEFVNEAMPDYAGFVFYQKSPRNITEARAEVLRAAINPVIETVGVFVDARIEQIISAYRKNICRIIQLHGSEDDAYIQQLRRILPKAVIWKAYQIRSKEDLEAAEASKADMVLLDNGAGTGNSFDWSLLSTFSRDFILAGGLTPQSIPMSIAKFHPFAVDLSSGVETEGVKDEKKIAAAVAAAKRS